MTILEVSQKRSGKAHFKALKENAPDTERSEYPSHLLRGRIAITDPAILEEIAEGDIPE